MEARSRVCAPSRGWRRSSRSRRRGRCCTVLLWLAPFMFLPLGSRWSLVAAVVGLERLLSDSPNHWGYGAHYSAPLAPILAAGAADTLVANPARSRERRAAQVDRARASDADDCGVRHGAGTPAGAAACLLPSITVSFRIARRRRRHSRRFLRTHRCVAQAAIVPHLTHRDRIYMLEDGAPEADFVIAASTRVSALARVKPGSRRCVARAAPAGGLSKKFLRRTDGSCSGVKVY